MQVQSNDEKEIIKLCNQLTGRSDENFLTLFREYSGQ